MKYLKYIKYFLILLLFIPLKSFSQVEGFCGRGEEMYPFPIITNHDKCFFFTSQYEECSAELEELDTITSYRKDFVVRELERVKKEMDYYCNN